MRKAKKKKDSLRYWKSNDSHICLSFISFHRMIGKNTVRSRNYPEKDSSFYFILLSFPKLFKLHKQRTCVRANEKEKRERQKPKSKKKKDSICEAKHIAHTPHWMCMRQPFNYKRANSIIYGFYYRQVYFVILAEYKWLSQSLFQPKTISLGIRHFFFLRISSLFFRFASVYSFFSCSFENTVVSVESNLKTGHIRNP